MAVGILKYPMRRKSLPHGNILYLPLKDMSIGTSPNLLTNAGFESALGAEWSALGTNATLEQSNEQKKSGSYSGKLTRNGENAYGVQELPAVIPYRGITATLNGWIYATVADRARLIVYQDGADQVSATHSGVAGWELLTDSFKLTAAAAWWKAGGLIGGGDTSAYYDDLVLTVPQMLSRDSFRRIVHPEGCIWTPQGFSFDGTYGLITCESDFIGTGACTILAWIKVTGYPASNICSIIKNGSMYVVAGGANDNLVTTRDDATGWGVSANGSIPQNTWARIAITFSGANPSLVSHYINGVLSGDANQNAGAPVAGTHNVCLGNGLSGGSWFTGLMDDIQVYKRVLSATEVIVDFTNNKSAHL